jgi:hypothetical protein
VLVGLGDLVEHPDGGHSAVIIEMNADYAVIKDERGALSTHFWNELCAKYIEPDPAQLSHSSTIQTLATVTTSSKG